MVLLMKKIEWFQEVVKRLPDTDIGKIWSPAGDEVLCKTEHDAEVIATWFELLYASQGENVVVKTGYYDPEEDKRNNEVDVRTGWWYVTID